MKVRSHFHENMQEIFWADGEQDLFQCFSRRVSNVLSTRAEEIAYFQNDTETK